MIKKIVFFIFIVKIMYSQVPVQHCGYDFTSFIVVDVHENGKKENVKGLCITIVDSNGVDVVNVENMYSWNRGNEILLFKQNYLLNEASEKKKYFFPYAEDQYVLSVNKAFPIEKFNVKVFDSSGLFETQIVPLEKFNLYVLCSSENEKAKMFGRRTNNPVEVILVKK